MRAEIAIAAAIMLSCCGSDGDPSPAAEPQAEGSTEVATVNGAKAPAPAPAADEEEAPPQNNGNSVSACIVQDGQRLAENALHAIGTEPFWAADVEGRCVTYSTPENQAGTRVWTHFEGTTQSGNWTGALDGKPFVMTTRPQRDCSDGMSDKVYPIAVTLKVRGEERRGCAERR